MKNVLFVVLVGLMVTFVTSCNNGNTKEDPVPEPKFIQGRYVQVRDTAYFRSRFDNGDRSYEYYDLYFTTDSVRMISGTVFYKDGLQVNDIKNPKYTWAKDPWFYKNHYEIISQWGEVYQMQLYIAPKPPVQVGNHIRIVSCQYLMSKGF